MDYLLTIFIARADNEGRGAMFRAMAGSIGFVL
jgi:hypothetical protein